MTRTKLLRPAPAAIMVALMLIAAAVQAQSVSVSVTVSPGPAGGRPWAANVIAPQSRSAVFAPAPAPSAPGTVVTARLPAVQVSGVEAGVVILEQAATTTLDISLRNPTARRQEAELLLPVPDGAAIRGFTFEGSAAEPTAQVLPRDEARRIYDDIVRQTRDPALLEFAGYNLVRSSVFPVEANGTQKIRLTYEHLLPRDGKRIDYLLPRSEAVDYAVPWKVSVQIKSRTPISTVYSPSHAIETTRHAPGAINLKVPDSAANEPGPFRLSYLLEGEGVTASLLAYPDPTSGGGYFLLLAGLPATAPAPGAQGVQREVTIVLDRSGSMRGEKIEQAREAAIQVIEALDAGEAFHLIVYNEAVEMFTPQPVLKIAESIKAARAYLQGVNARGGTNIHDALFEALRQKPHEGMLPIVLFLTDGLPTVGQTSEVAIRQVASEGNPFKRRIFTFGVGVDVNTPLLEKIADLSRATPTFVMPTEDVEVKVAQVFRRLSGPVVAEPMVKLVGGHGEAAAGRVIDLLPARLPDLFEGDQIVLLGRYFGEQPLHFRVSGDYLGQPREFKFEFALDKASTQNAFVPRLWASRKIADLVQAIRDLGADSGVRPGHAPSAAHDPRVGELVDEIVRLSTEFGVLTEYTAFLAREGTNLADRDEVLRQAIGNFRGRAIAKRSGLDSVNQESNNVFMKAQSVTNSRNAYWDEKMQRVEITNCQQVSDRAYYQRDGRWIDSKLVGTDATPTREVETGSEEYRRLSDELIRQGRQASLALPGEKVVELNGEAVLVR